MKRFIFAVILMVAALELRAQTGLSSLLVTNINALDFKVNISPTNAVTNIVKMNLSRSQFQAPVVPGDVWTLTNISGVYGGSTNIITNSIWGIDGSGRITPIVTNNAVIATNIVRAGHGVNTGSETWQTKSITLTNGVNYLPVSDWSQLQLISPSSDPSLVQIVLSNGWSTVQHLEIFNLTNAVPSQGAFTLTNLTPIPDSLGGGVVKLINNENWVATNGCGIELRFISPDWVEQFRSDVSGNPTFISNTFNNITVISNTTLRGRITINNVSITTNTLWTTNTVAGSVNLKPVDDLVAVSTPNALFVGKNSLLLYGGTSGTDDIISYKSDTNGATSHTIKFDSQQDGAPPHGVWTLNVDTNGSSILTTAVNSSGNGVGWQWSIGEPTQNFMTWISNGITGALFFPDQVDGSTPYKFNTWLTHSTGNLFELSNNSTSRVVVTPLSTLIGSPVTSPNFSVPAALEVSNFQDRGKALTVDIKLGASGNNDDYPVYFYSQITNSSAHPTINMEEVSPSGYIGGAHTLLSVQETPKVTNTVSTWPTYAAASTTAGYFNAAPTGGTNGAAMGLQGSVDPTRNFINIGVGSYVEASTDNLAATNIAFSGTVNQVQGTQKAVGGLFEIGSLANIPSIPSSAGVLIDGHNSGAPLIIAQTNGAVQFKVAANSGYAGGGTTFLADDGTYKAAGGNMTNSGAAVVGMVPVATSTSGGSWTPTNALSLNTLSTTGQISMVLSSNTSAITITNSVDQTAITVNTITNQTQPIIQVNMAGKNAWGLYNDNGLYNYQTNTLALRGGPDNSLGATNGVMQFMIYRTFTDMNNWERLRVGWAGTECQLLTEAAGTGKTNRALVVGSLMGQGSYTIATGGFDRWRVSYPGEFYPADDALYDIGDGNSVIGAGHRVRKIHNQMSLTGVIRVVTNNASSTLFYIPVANTNAISGKFLYSLEVTDGTETQAVNGECRFAAVAKGTAVSAQILDSQTASATFLPAAVSSGTLTNVIAAITSTNNVFAVGFTPTTSLTSTNMVVKWKLITPAYFTVNSVAGF